jgi:hypothetical protein
MSLQGIFTRWQSNTTRFPKALNCLDRSAGNTNITNGGARVIEASNIANYSFGAFEAEGPVRSAALIDGTLADSSGTTAAKDAITRAVQSARDDIDQVKVAAAYRDTIIGNFPNTNVGRQLADIAAFVSRSVSRVDMTLIATRTVTMRTVGCHGTLLSLTLRLMRFTRSWPTPRVVAAPTM